MKANAAAVDPSGKKLRLSPFWFCGSLGSKSDASCQLDSVWFLCGSLGSNPHASFQFDLVWFLLYIQHASCQPNFFLFVAAHWAAHVYVAFHRMIWI